MGGGGTFSLEQFAAFDPANRKSLQAVVEYIHESATLAREHGFPMGFDEMAVTRMKGVDGGQSYLDNLRDNRMYKWQWKIRQMLDPNDVGERGSYLVARPTEQQIAVDPIEKSTRLSSWGGGYRMFKEAIRTKCFYILCNQLAPLVLALTSGLIAEPIFVRLSSYQTSAEGYSRTNRSPQVILWLSRSWYRPFSGVIEPSPDQKGAEDDRDQDGRVRFQVHGLFLVA